MTPHQLAKSGTEHGHQAALFCYVAIALNHGFAFADAFAELGAIGLKDSPKNGIPELEWYHAIPNGGSRGDTQRSAQINGGKMKAEGVKSGVSDTFLPVKRDPWSGLYIEMKKPTEKPKREGSKGGVSDEQSAFGAFVKSQGFGFVVCYSWQEAVEVLKQYLNWGK